MNKIVSVTKKWADLCATCYFLKNIKIFLKKYCFIFLFVIAYLSYGESWPPRF